MASVWRGLKATVKAPELEEHSLLGAFALWARPQASFACVEIAKGLAILGIGDMIVAEEVGELVAVAALVAHRAQLPLLAPWPSFGLEMPERRLPAETRSRAIPPSRFKSTGVL
jgi:hypothetical protein